MSAELLLTFLQSRINARVLEIVHNHFTDEQIGLLLVKAINPYAHLTQQEEAQLRGVDRKTLRGMKARGEVEMGVNAKESPNRPKSGVQKPISPQTDQRRSKGV